LIALTGEDLGREVGEKGAPGGAAGRRRRRISGETSMAATSRPPQRSGGATGLPHPCLTTATIDAADSSSCSAAASPCARAHPALPPRWIPRTRRGGRRCATAASGGSDARPAMGAAAGLHARRRPWLLRRRTRWVQGGKGRERGGWVGWGGERED
jgi:hypothetical protein